MVHEIKAGKWLNPTQLSPNKRTNFIRFASCIYSPICVEPFTGSIKSDIFVFFNLLLVGKKHSSLIMSTMMFFFYNILFECKSGNFKCKMLNFLETDRKDGQHNGSGDYCELA